PPCPPTGRPSRTLAPSGFTPAARLARRWWSRSQHWSSRTWRNFRRSRSAGERSSFPSRSKSSCSSCASSLILSTTSWSSICSLLSWFGSRGEREESHAVEPLPRPHQHLAQVHAIRNLHHLVQDPADDEPGVEREVVVDLQ